MTASFVPVSPTLSDLSGNQGAKD